MEKKQKKIDVININRDPEAKRKAQREKQVLDIVTEEMNKREKIIEKMKRKIIKKENKKKKIRIGMMGIAGALALTIGGCYTKLTDKEPSKKESAVEQEGISFTSRKEKLKIEKENLLAFLKNLYIEQYEEITGDTTKTTEDITLKTSYENYVFINMYTGEIITHGDEPALTEQKLMNDAVSYIRKDNLKLYKVYNTQGEIIDCVTMKDGIPTKVTIGEQYGQNTTSILDKMQSVIPDGIDCIDYIEGGKESNISAGKAKFMKSLENFEKNKKEIEKIGDELEL